MNILLDLFLTFAKIGLFTFGGGYAMISMIENNKLTNPPSDEVLAKICLELSFTEEEKNNFYDLIDEEFLPKRVVEKIHKLKDRTQNKTLTSVSNNNELQKELSALTVEEQKKVLKFIKEFIKK